MPELDLGRHHHYFFEKAFIKELTLLATYQDFYKKLAILLPLLPATRLIVNSEVISIIAEAASTDKSTPPHKITNKSHNNTETKTTTVVTTEVTAEQSKGLRELRKLREPEESQDLKALESPSDRPKTTQYASEPLEPLQAPEVLSEVLKTAETTPSEQLARLLKELIPWRKGPYNILGHHIESEWLSHLKWQRLEKEILPHCKDKCIVDVGANNGYFMYRLLNAGAKWVLGLEPTARYVAQYDLIRACLTTSPSEPVLACHHLLLLGYEALVYLENRVDIVLLLGILYHHPNPLHILTLTHRSLRKGGKVIIDCEGVAHSDHVALFPKSTYTNKRGFWFLPSREVLLAWLKRTGFRDITLLYENPLERHEQRRTPWAPTASLNEGLATSDHTEPATPQTSEGYPPPMRYYLSAYK